MIEVGLRPPRHRGAFVTFDVPAAALEAGGAVYFPSASGAVIEGPVMNTETSTQSGVDRWRCGVITEAQFAAAIFTPGGGLLVNDLWPGGQYRIAGTVQSGTFFSIGDFLQISLGVPYSSSMLVMPGNFWFIAGTAANLVAEGGFQVHEFVNPDEFEQWRVSREA